MMVVDVRCREERYKHCYDYDRLKVLFEYADKDIRRLHEAIAQVEEFKKNLSEHMGHVEQTSLTTYVEVTRRDYDSIVYYVKVVHHPDIEEVQIGGDFVYGKFERHERFSGRDRNKAIEYAKELADEHNCKIVLKGLNIPKQIKEYVI